MKPEDYWKEDHERETSNPDPENFGCFLLAAFVVLVLCLAIKKIYAGFI